MANYHYAPVGPLQKVINPTTGATIQIIDAEGVSVGFYGTYPIINNSGAQTVSVLIKTGPALVYSIVQTSGAGKPTVRDGTTIGGALVSGWGDGGASGLTLTANTPYAPSIPPSTFSNGIYLEINGTATVVLFYQ